jgi:glucosamine 6-phosphate synthetase-like amidotransferase/phosphosugar isomerase protein
MIISLRTISFHSCGLSIYDINTNRIGVIKENCQAKIFIRSKQYKNFCSLYLTNPKEKIILGHTRMETDGSQRNYHNNQPVIKDGNIVVHNGIVTNVNKLWKKFPNLTKEYEIDTEIISSLFSHYKKKNNIQSSISKIFSITKGSASIGLISKDTDYLCLATNTGSIYFAKGKDFFYFASEKYILSKIFSKKVNQLSPGKGLMINPRDMLTNIFSFDDFKNNSSKFPIKKTNSIINDYTFKKKITKNQRQLSNDSTLLENNYDRISKIKRCTKCILPETFPFIKFDNHGVCNYCNNYIPVKLKPINELYKKMKSKKNYLVTFSGGRDSFSLISFFYIIH